MAADFSIDAAFPGGNIILERIEGGDVFLRQDLRDTAGDWFYWCFRVTGAAGRRLTFHFTGSDVIGVRGPAVSSDGGRSWRWLGRECVDGKSFTATVADAPETRFSLGMSYTGEHLHRFLAALTGTRVRTETLCDSRRGRPVELLRLSPPRGEPRFRVAAVCRHHACEMMASYVLEGFVIEALSPSPEGTWLAASAAMLMIPFVDRDGVQDGDQGKNRTPHDHNRDYAGQSIYPETAAIRALLPAWSDGRPTVSLDLHCPWIRGRHNEDIYQVGSPFPAVWKEQRAFGRILEESGRGPLPYSAANDLPFGVDWNTAEPAEVMSCTRWCATLPGVRLATSLEVPYANAGGADVTADTARAFGRDLARAVCRYLREKYDG